MGTAKPLHLAISSALRGSGGGGEEQPRQPIESPDSLRSIAYARIVDLVSEGEIVGFADQENPMSCVFLNETPVANPDGSLNFENIQVDSRVGTQTQDYLPNFEGVESEIGIGAELEFGTPWVRSITNTNIDAIRIRLSVPVLTSTNTSTGDITGARVQYTIDLQTDGGAFVTKLSSAFAGKTTSKYERSHYIELPPASTGWTVRVTRNTPNSTSSTLQNPTVVESYTEIVEAKLRMPMSALVSVIVAAEQFGNVPSRAYRLKGRIIRVPSNYDPDTRTYTGVWDGTFQSRYSNNPAWVFYDMALNKRYGLGHLTPNELVDKWTLYRIAQYCDELVADGFGGFEPRFTCNVVFQSQNDALRVMQDLATVFRGVIYANGGAITAVSDMPEDPAYTYTPANVIEGKFVYSGSSRKVRHTVALVSWSDMSDFGRAKVEYVDDPDGIARYGIQQTEVIAMGCTSRGQARRLGRYLLATERYETDTVSFGVGMDGTIVAPGTIINIADPLRAGLRRGGRIKSATVDSVDVDVMSISVVAGDTLVVTLPTGVTERRTIQSIEGTVITVAAPFSAVPVAQSVWAADSEVAPLAMYRVLGVSERNEGDSLGYTLTCVVHVPGKFAFADTGIPFETTPVPPVQGPVVPSPTGLVISQRDVADQNTSGKIVNLSWTAVTVAVGYGVQWRQGDGNWIDLGTVGFNNIDLPNVLPGPFEVQVVAINSMGNRSQPTFGGPYDITPVVTPPGFVTDIQTGMEVLEEIALQNQGDIAQEIADRIADVDAAEAQLQSQINVLNGQIGDIMGADDWVSTNTYVLGDIVKHSNRLYRSLQNSNTNHQPVASTTDAWWQYIGDYTSLGEAVGAHSAQISINTTDIQQLDDELVLQAQQLDALEVEVDGKASSTALQALEVRVTTAEDVNTSQANSITALNSALNGYTGANAVSNAISGLDTRVDATEAAITSQASSITSLTATIDGIGNPNLLPNSSGADGLNGWSFVGGATSGNTGVVTELFGKYGNIFRSVLPSNGTAFDHGLAVPLPYVSVPDGGSRQFTLSADIFRNSAAGSGVPFVEIRWYNSVNSSLGSSVLSSTAAANAWKRDSATFAAPATAAKAQIIMRLQSTTTGAGGLVGWSRIKFEQGNVATPWSDEATTAANASAVTLLTARVTAAEGSITSQASSITSLTASMNAVFGTTGLGGDNLIRNSNGQYGVEDIINGSTNLTSNVFADGHQWRFNPNTGSALTRTVDFEAIASQDQVFSASMDAYVASANASGTFAIDYLFLNSSNGVILDGGNTTITARDQWLRYNLTTVAAPANTAKIRIRVIAIAATWSTFAFRRVKLNFGSAVTPYSEEYATRATGNAVTSLDTRVTATEGSITSQASSITSLEASLSNNITVVNPGFEYDTGWGGLSGAGYNLQNNVTEARGGNRYLRKIPVAGDTTQARDSTNQFFAVKGEQQIRYGGYVRAFNTITATSYGFIVVAYDTAGSIVGSNSANRVGGAAHGWQLVEGVWDVPATATVVHLRCRVVGHTAGTIGFDDTYVQMVDPKAAGAATASAVQALDARVVQTEAGLVTYNASYTLVLDVNGYVSGFKSVNNGTTAIFSIVADKFQIVSPAGGARTEFSNGNWRVYDAAGVLRVRMGIW